MKTIITLMMLLFAITFYGQKTIKHCLKAEGPELKETIDQIKYGTPVCIEVSGVNTFFMQTSSTYTPINFDFATKGFSDIKIEEVGVDLSQKSGNGNKSNSEMLNKKNENLQKFKDEFKIFQKHFSNINGYISLKKTLLEQIQKDSIFIQDTLNFKKRSTSSYNAVYNFEKDYLSQKTRISVELEELSNSYLNLISIYRELNNSHKKEELKLSGELKDKDNVLKFDKITATFENKYFEDEMAKTKVIIDKLTESENRIKIFTEAQAGIDLYHEIIKSKFQVTIISKNVYDDGAEIKPQLKDSKGKVMYEYREFKVNTYGNWKVNGSAGYFLNFISDDNYTLRKKIETDSNSKTGVSESSSNTLKHSLGGLLHAYYNFEGNIDAGFSVGLSINDNANAGFYFGLSAFVTESNRLVLTSGISFNKVKRLNASNLLYESGEYDFTNESDTEIKYDEVYKPAFFIGITYNLFK
jgi:hypothetical protein